MTMDTPAENTLTEYHLFDTRYITDRESAICYDVCETLEEANEEKKKFFTDAVIVKVAMKYRDGSYDDIESEEVVG